MLRFRSLACLALALAILACSLPLGTQPAPAPATAGAPTSPTEPSITATPLFDPAQLKQAMDAAFTANMQQNSVVSCSLAAVYPDTSGKLQTSYFNYGTLSKKSATPVDENTEFEIGSITKLFTSDLLALFVQDGLMKLDDPLQAYMPANVQVPTYQGKVITLSELSTHTSGLPRNVGGGTAIRTVDGVQVSGYSSDDEVYKFLNGYQLTRAPGSRWEYSNLANGLLGMAEEQAGKSSYEQLVLEKLTGPLGMPDTRIQLSAQQKTRLAQGYTDGGQNAVPFATTGDTLAAGALRSTTRDLAVYLAANIDPTGNGLEPVLRMTQAPQAKASQNITMGLGWLIANPNTPDALFNKAGSTLGYNSYIAFSQSRRTGFVVLCSGSALTKLLPQIETLLKLPVLSTDANE